MIKYDCIYECCDDDCDKCGKRGILLNGCPMDCEDFVNHHGKNAKGEEVIHETEKDNNKRSL